MPKLIGSFYFDRTASGNLVGEFVNNQSSFVMTESANPKGKFPNFIGKYDSTWLDTSTHL